MLKTADNETEPSKACEQQQLCLFSTNDRGHMDSHPEQIAEQCRKQGSLFLAGCQLGAALSS